MSDEDTPGPIPNPAVKPASADGTRGAAPWESRSLPRDFLLPVIVDVIQIDNKKPALSIHSGPVVLAIGSGSTCPLAVESMQKIPVVP